MAEQVGTYICVQEVYMAIKELLAVGTCTLRPIGVSFLMYLFLKYVHLRQCTKLKEKKGREKKE